MVELDQESCFQEISHDVLDNDKLVNVSAISEKWGCSMKKSAEILEQWLGECGEGKLFVKRYLVRGVAENGSIFVTISPEEELATVAKQIDKRFQILYSIKLGSESSAITIPSFLDAHKKRLILPNSNQHKRDPNQYVNENVTKPDPPIKSEPIESPKSSTTTTGKTNGSSSNNNKIASMFKNVKTEVKTPKKNDAPNANEKTSPKKKSPGKKEVGKKNGLIGSFFSAKPQSSSEKPPQSIEAENTNRIEEDKSIRNAKDSEKLNGKRNSITSDHSEENNTEESPNNPAKRRRVQKEKKKARAKGSRIMLMTDSDEDEESEAKTDKELEEATEAMEEAEEVAASPNATNGNARSVRNDCGTVRSKKRRMVTKTYEDEDGFIRTVKESEEYSGSEQEDNVDLDKTMKQYNSPVKTEVKKKSNPSPLKSAKVTSKPATKQGNIMSFFKKK